MNFSLIVCTYRRPKALISLLKSVAGQNLYPNQILIVDGSEDTSTKEALRQKEFENLEYYQVTEKNRGLTRQRNFGISKVPKGVDIVCFLDDDTVLQEDYFSELISTYHSFPDAQGVGGYIINETGWRKMADKENLDFDEFEYEGWVRKLGSRNVLRKRLKLLSDTPPGMMPDASNGFSVGYLPPSGKVYPVDFFMGGVSSFKKELLEQIKFSEFFEGYGLYEDMDFCLRASKKGQLYVNTAAKLYHYHDEGGRPNRFNYGKMVIRNGWYVWRVKNPEPSLKAKLKWNATSFLLTVVRLSNVLDTKKRKEAFTEAAGRIAGWWSLFLRKPK